MNRRIHGTPSICESRKRPRQTILHTVVVMFGARIDSRIPQEILGLKLSQSDALHGFFGVNN